ncbi:hypothetical protein OG271_23475 [Micromonospora rifamycinica]|uniref:hypothetical protein n=1 Tax=Micromonospora rifamycinica TaxID=291594 RepID=UPI002E2D9414|nr:hypothetical protein [Micromonospora rifamycinica]
MTSRFARTLGALALVLGALAVPATPAAAHATADPIGIYPPIQGSSTWDRFGSTPPASHHIVFGNWGYTNDWAVDIYRNPGATVVYSSCYQVNGDSGAHIHLEVINQHRYSRYVKRAAGTTLTDETVVGQVGTHYSGQRAAC